MKWYVELVLMLWKKLVITLTKYMCMYINCVVAHLWCGEAIKQNDLRATIQIITKLCELSS